MELGWRPGQNSAGCPCGAIGWVLPSAEALLAGCAAGCRAAGRARGWFAVAAHPPAGSLLLFPPSRLVILWQSEGNSGD